MHGWSPLHYTMTCEDEDPKLVSLLLAIKGNPNCREQHGLTQLHVASVLSRLVQARALIRKQDEEVNGSDNYGLTPLHYSVHCVNHETTRCLLKMGADPYHTDHSTIHPHDHGHIVLDYGCMIMIVKLVIFWNCKLGRNVLGSVSCSTTRTQA